MFLVKVNTKHTSTLCGKYSFTALQQVVLAHTCSYRENSMVLFNYISLNLTSPCDLIIPMVFSRDINFTIKTHTLYLSFLLAKSFNIL
jgi:hypothetical protein